LQGCILCLKRLKGYRLGVELNLQICKGQASLGLNAASGENSGSGDDSYSQCMFHG
jgi:hypothetical protein